MESYECRKTNPEFRFGWIRTCWNGSNPMELVIRPELMPFFVCTWKPTRKTNKTADVKNRLIILAPSLNAPLQEHLRNVLRTSTIKTWPKAVAPKFWPSPLTKNIKTTRKIDTGNEAFNK
jgi:hypothetical protein